MKKMTLKLLCAAFLAFAFTFVSCRKDAEIFKSKPAEYFDAKVATDWFEIFRTLTKKTAGFTPPVASRAFGYAGVAIYETVNPGMTNYQSLVGQLNQMPILTTPDFQNLEYNWAIAANASMAFVARNFYANMPADQLIGVQNLEDANFKKLQQGVSQDVIDRSKEWGLFVAKTIFEWSKMDGGHEGYLKNFPTNYVAPTGAGKWTPTFPKFQPAMQPFWGNNRTFIANCAVNTQPTFPIAYSESNTSLFNVAALEVYTTVKNLTPEQKATALFWSDDPGVPGTPPGHMISVTTQVINQQNAGLAKAAEAYAKVGIAVSDAFVSCWKCKFQYNYLRPISFIRGKIDSTWTSVLATPPFPEYTSGHSVQSGATAKVLSEMFGYNFAFSDNTHATRTDIDGTPRAYKSFNAMAAEAGISRLYGGIHYREAIEKGTEQGTSVGEEVTKLTFKKK